MKRSGRGKRKIRIKSAIGYLAILIFLAAAINHAFASYAKTWTNHNILLAPVLSLLVALPASAPLFSSLRLRRAAYFTIIAIIAYSYFGEVAAVLTSPNSPNAGFISSAAVSFVFPASAVIYLIMVEQSKEGIIKRLGLDPSGITLRNILLGVYVFFIIILLELITGLIGNITNTPINTNVQSLFAGAPVWFYAFAAIVAPLDEETLFRGLMVPRVGMVISSILFALPHWSYNSTFSIEVIAAFVFGMLAAYLYKKTGSLYPSLTAHILVNLITVVTSYGMFIV